MDLRKAHFSGSWYPADPAGCEREIKDFLSGPLPALDPGVKKTGGIVPHAGWFFSGKIAANVIAALKDGPDPDAVAVLGMHLAPNHPNFIMASGAWETPLGPLEVHQELAQSLAEGFSFEMETADSHTRDNTIELQLPFIKYLFPETRIVPIGVPPVERSLAIGKSLVDLAGHLGVTLKVVGSTDLTHYGPNYGFLSHGTGAEALKWVKEKNDAAMIERMLAMDPMGVINQAVKSQNACCGGAAATAIEAARHLGADKAQLLTYATSHEKHANESFVGYAGIVF